MSYLCARVYVCICLFMFNRFHVISYNVNWLDDYYTFINRRDKQFQAFLKESLPPIKRPCGRFLKLF